MATARKNLFDKFMAAQAEEDQFAICAEYILLHIDARDRTDDVDGFKQRMQMLEQVICEDAKKPEVLERFLAKMLEPLSPEMRKRVMKSAKKK